MNEVGSDIKRISLESADEYFNEWAEDILKTPSKSLILDCLRKASRFLPIGNDITHIKIKDRWLVAEGTYWDDRSLCGVHVNKKGQTFEVNACGEIAELITE